MSWITASFHHKTFRYDGIGTLWRESDWRSAADLGTGAASTTRTVTVDPFGRAEKVVSTRSDGVADSIVVTSYTGTRQLLSEVLEANGTTLRSRTTTELDAIGNVIKVTEDKGGSAG
jgi:hypothetical protein